MNDVRSRVEAVVAAAVEMAEGGKDPFEAASAAPAHEQRDVLAFLAQAAIVDHVRRVGRTRALAVEREAEQLPDTRPPKRGSRAYDRWVESTEEGHRHEVEFLQWQRRHHDGLMTRLRDATEQYARELRMQWTAELLTTSFALPDGATVTWGAATVEQHEERAAMFMSNAQANVEGAARHQAAVTELRQAGQSCLNALVSVAA